MVFIHSYNYSIYKEYLSFDKRSILLNGDIPAEVLKTIKINIPGCSISIFTNNITTTLGPSNNGLINYYANMIGASADFLHIPLPGASAANNIFKTSISSGRDISPTDIMNRNRVAVISELTQSVLFGSENAVGKRLKLTLNNNDQDFIELSIIGVYKNTPDDFRQIERINTATTNQQYLQMIVNIYIPDSLVDEAMTSERHTQTAVITRLDTMETIDLLELILKPYRNSIQVFTYQSHMTRLEQINSSMQNILSMATIALVIISGITLMNSLLFLIKERIGEIGIKKSLGASSEVIIIQFFVEVICICVTGAIIGTIISLAATNIMKPILANVLITDIDLIFSVKIIIASFLLALLEAVLFSIIPVIHASNIKIVDALNQD